MICPNCGSENTNEATFCKFCGQRFGPKQNSSTDTQNTENNTYDSWNNQPDNSDGWNTQPNWDNQQNWNNQQNWDSQQNWNNQNNRNNQQGNPNDWNNQNSWNQQNSGANYNYQNNGYQPPYNNGHQPYNGFAIAALVIGILSILPCCLFPYIGIPMNIVGLVLAIIGYKKPYGRGMAIASIVLNIVFLVLAIVWLIICFYIYANIDMNAYYNIMDEFY